MSTLLQLAGSTVGGILWKWTTLLVLGWVAHGWLRRCHARWRLILWRSILVFSLVLPLVSCLSLPVLTIPLYNFTNVTPMNTDVGPVQTTAKVVQKENPAPKSAENAVMTGTPMVHAKAVLARSITKPLPWKTILFGVWILGCVGGAARLLWFQLQLTRLRKQAAPPQAALVKLTKEIQARLSVRRNFGLRISNAIQSPFVCGLWRPTIMLPQRLTESLSTDEAAALLRHEVAHLRGQDLFWSAGWRWMQVIGWFHPLVWKIPAAHSLACEQEADRVASCRVEEREGYAQLLAQLALRVLSLPAVETRLTLNGTAQIVRRLQHLKRKSADVWKTRHTVVGLGLAGLLFVIAVGCQFSKAGSAQGPAAVGGFKRALVEVQDENGRPIEGASITPFGFRVKGIHGADAYGWTTNVFGPEQTVITSLDGKAYLKYAVMGIPEEKEYTRSLIFSVTDPEYSTVTIQDYPVDQSNAPIRMIQGITLEVSGWYGAGHEPVTEISPILADGVLPAEDWIKSGSGVLAYHKLSPGGHLILLMGRLPSGGIVYSDSTPFTAEEEKASQLALEMKPGIRLEGRLDANVPRPVKNGRVMMDVRPKEYPTLNVIEDYYVNDKKYGGRNFWHSYRPINEDGTFVFESVPPGEADVVVLGDGFAAKSEGQLASRVNGQLVKGPMMAIPQAFQLTAPVTQIEVKTEPTATLEFKATDKKGRPLEGIWVGMYPSVFRLWGMYGWMKNNSSETPYRAVPQLPDPVFSGKTDQDGRLVIRDIPAETRGLQVESLKYQVPLQDTKGWRDRYVRTTFAVGETNRLEMTLEPKGKDFIGTAR
jgi:beta-lactamase regulating signal transducer with metallopeptidase domain